MRSADARSVPVWVALPIVLLLGAGGYGVIRLAANERPDATSSGYGAPAQHGDSSGHADSHGNAADTDGQNHGDTGDGHGDGDDQVPAGDRPRALVLGGFAAINGAVLVSAAVLRRRGGNRRRSRGGSTRNRRP